MDGQPQPGPPPMRRRIASHGIRNRLAILFALGALPVALALVLEARSERAEAKQLEFERIRYVVSETADQHQHVREFAEQLLLSLSADPAIVSQNGAACGLVLARALANRQEHFTNISLLTLEGDVVCSGRGRTTPYPWARLPAFQRALTSAAAVPGQVMLSPTQRLPIVPMFYGVRDATGRVVAVLRAGLRLSWLEEIPTRVALPYGAVVGLLDDHERVAFRFPDPEHKVGQQVSGEPLAKEIKAHGGRGTVETIGLDGKLRLFAFERFGADDDQRLTVWFAVPVASVLAPAYRATLLSTGVATLLLLALMLLLWSGATRMVVAPIDHLIAAFRRLGAGDVHARAELSSGSREFMQLAAAFDQTVVALASLEATVRRNRALNLMVAVKGARIGADDERTLLADICQRVAAKSDFPLVFICRAEFDAARTLTLLASDGTLDEAVASGATWADTDAGRGPTGAAVRENRTVMVANWAAPELPEEDRLRAARAGFGSSLSLPLRDEGGAASGVLTVFAREADAFNVADTHLLEEVGLDIGMKLTALRDRIARKAAQDALADSESLLTRAEELGRAGSWRMNLKTNAVQPSAELLRIVGVASREFAGRAGELLKYIHPADRSWVERAFLHSVVAGSGFDVLHRLVTKSGAIRHVHVRSEIVFDAAGVPTHAVGTLRDITDEVATRQALAERVKEANCLRQVFALTEDISTSVDETLQRVVDVLPSGWTHDGDAVARIRHAGETYASPGFVETAWMQTTRFEGPHEGELTIGYLHEHEPLDDGVFLAEERGLIDAIGRRLGEKCQARVTAAQAKEREEIYAAVFNQARDAIVTVDVETGKFVDFNEVAHASLGYSREELAALGMAQLDAALTPQQLAAATQEMMRPEGHVIETRLRCRDGSLRDVRVSARPIEVNGRSMLAAVWSDMTDIKRTEAALRRTTTEQRMLAAANRAILFCADEQSMMHAVCEVLVAEQRYPLAWIGMLEPDGEQRVLPVAYAGEGAGYVNGLDVSWADNPRGQGPTGRAVRERRPATSHDIVADPAFAPWRAAALGYGLASSFGIPLPAPDGSLLGVLTVYATEAHAFDLDESALLLRVADSLAFGLQAMRDRADRDRAQTQVRKLTRAVEQSPASIAITDLEARIEYINPAFAAQTGYTLEELQGLNSRVLHSGKTPPETYAAMWGALSQGQTWQGEFFNKRKDGTEYTELATLAPIRDESGLVTHYVAVKDDITERKRLDVELAHYRDHLEELVNTRTAQVREAQERAEQANLAKSAFLANMSHEIRTPLNAIIGLTHLLSEQVQVVEHADRLRKIDFSARHLLAIINDILDLSKVEAGKLRIEGVDFALPDVMQSVQDSLADRAREKGLDLRFEIAPDLPQWLNADPLRLTQILLNLGTNAVKFTTHGHVTMRARPDTQDAQHPVVRFEIEDTGIGLTPEQTQRIFQPFEQADVSTTRQYGGTGLGLTICRRLVDLQGGTLGVDSVLGQGSTFWFTLPLRAVSEVQATVAANVSSGLMIAMPADREPSSVRVLLVEDDPINQEVALELLTSRGFVVEVAGNGAVALDMAEAKAYDVILMDVQMPVMDGLTATRALRDRADYAATPILAMTASAFAEDKEACLAAGMDDFVAKPIHPPGLFHALLRWTGAKVLQSDIRPSHLGHGEATRQRVMAIRGLDASAGLRVVQGNWELYERLLRKFCVERGEDVVLLRNHIAAARWQDAERAAHTLKGVSGTLGAMAVRAAVVHVEEMLQRGERKASAFAEYLDELGDQHDALIRALAASLPDEVVPPTVAVDWPTLREELAQLQALLGNDDVRALQYFRAHQPMLRAAFGPAMDGIGRAVEGFDFEAAIALLRDAVAPTAELQ